MEKQDLNQEDSIVHNTLEVYQLDSNDIYVGIAYADEDPMTPGTFLIPGGCVTVKPPELSAHQAAKYTDGVWSVVPDWRSATLYKRADGSVVMGIAIGDTPESLLATELPRPTADYVWDGATNNWTLDAAKRLARLTAEANAQKSYLLAYATTQIAPLQDAVDLDIATPAETALLTAWKQYRVAVNRINMQAGFPETITWPVQPA